MLRILVIGLALVVIGSSVADAQVTVPGPISGPGGGGAQRRRGQSAEPAPPVGVPGSRAEPTLAAPAERAPADMPPTEALFDAINRGDLPAAKDAIGRGADIGGRNILGLTPLEQSVDLGRNEISFLLLSLRGGAGYSAASTARKPATPERKTAAEVRAERLAEQKARGQHSAEARALRAGAGADAPPHTARLFAGDGGAPVPQAGFLGFGSAR